MMMHKATFGSRILASVLALSIAGQAFPAVSQTTPNSQPTSAPPVGQYAPPPSGSEANGSTYDQSAQRDDRAYADQYARWAAQNCVDQHNNTVAGAAIGGVLGAVLGSGIAGRGAHVAGAVAGGAVGATAGAAIGANSNTACPPGYLVAPGAPAFYYTGIANPPAVVHGPAWYRPWVWVGGRWVYRPYRYWYWANHAYWRPGWRPGVWGYHYRRW